MQNAIDCCRASTQCVTSVWRATLRWGIFEGIIHSAVGEYMHMVKIWKFLGKLSLVFVYLYHKWFVDFHNVVGKLRNQLRKTNIV